MMLRWIVMLLLFSLLGCARHHLIERDLGRVDGAKSISSTSETAWQVKSEPSGDGADAEASATE